VAMPTRGPSGALPCVLTTNSSEEMRVDSLVSAAFSFAVALWLSVAFSAMAGVDIFCIRSESVPRIGWIFRFNLRTWGPPEPVARPLGREDRQARALVLVVLGLLQVLPAVWILLGNDPQRNGLIGLLALFYLLELGWWAWLSRLPREVVYGTLPQVKQSRDRTIADEVAQFDAAYRARESAPDSARIERPR
jgi:hypothetical protein